MIVDCRLVSRKWRLMIKTDNVRWRRSKKYEKDWEIGPLNLRKNLWYGEVSFSIFINFPGGYYACLSSG